MSHVKSTAVANVVSTEVAVLQSLATQLGPEVEKCVELLRRTPGNILVVGMGTSGTVARRAAHLLACCGAPAFYVHPINNMALLEPLGLLILFWSSQRAEKAAK